MTVWTDGRNALLSQWLVFSVCRSRYGVSTTETTGYLWQMFLISRLKAPGWRFLVAVIHKSIKFDQIAEMFRKNDVLGC